MTSRVNYKLEGKDADHGHCYLYIFLYYEKSMRHESYIQGSFSILHMCEKRMSNSNASHRLYSSPIPGDSWVTEDGRKWKNIVFLHAEGGKRKRTGITSVNRALSHQKMASSILVKEAADALSGCYQKMTKESCFLLSNLWP